MRISFEVPGKMRARAALAASLALLALAGCGKKPAGPDTGAPPPDQIILPPGAEGAPKYRPHLAPRFKAGEVFNYEASANMISDMRSRDREWEETPAGRRAVDRPPNEHREHLRVAIEAEALVRATYPSGELREAVYLVRRCELSRTGANTLALAPPGSVLGVRKLDSGQVLLALDGVLLPPERANFIGMVMQLGDEKNSLDALFGPPAPVPVGAKWTVNPRRVLDSGFAQTYPGANQALGGLRLEAVETGEGGREMTTVAGTFSLGGVKAPFEDDIEAPPSVVNFQLRTHGPMVPGAGIFETELKTQIAHIGRSGSLNYGMRETILVLNVDIEQRARYAFDSALPVPPALASAPALPDKVPPPPAPVARGRGAAQPPAATVK